MQLGAPKEEVAGDLSRVLLAKGEPQRVIDLVGDVDQWPQPRRLVLALSKAEAALALPSYDPRELTKSFVECVPLALIRAGRRCRRRSRVVRSSHAELRSKQAAVEGGYQHFACTRDAPATSPPR